MEASSPSIARRAPRGVFAASLALSAALHALVLVFFPEVSFESAAARVAVLDVVLVPAAPARPSAQPRSETMARPPAVARARAAQKPKPAPLAAGEKEEERPSLSREESQPLASLRRPPEPHEEGAAAREAGAQQSSEARAPARPTEIAPALRAATYLRNPPPRYPLAARRAGQEGTVTLKVLVTREGLPARVDVEKTSGSPSLDQAALEAVKGWRFAPARRGAEPIESWVLVPIVFRLEGAS